MSDRDSPSVVRRGQRPPSKRRNVLMLILFDTLLIFAITGLVLRYIFVINTNYQLKFESLLQFFFLDWVSISLTAAAVFSLAGIIVTMIEYVKLNHKEHTS